MCLSVAPYWKDLHWMLSISALCFSKRGTNASIATWMIASIVNCQLSCSLTRTGYIDHWNRGILELGNDVHCGSCSGFKIGSNLGEISEHGDRQPDPTLRYRATAPIHVSYSGRRMLAWAVGGPRVIWVRSNSQGLLCMGQCFLFSLGPLTGTETSGVRPEAGFISIPSRGH